MYRRHRFTILLLVAAALCCGEALTAQVRVVRSVIGSGAAGSSNGVQRLNGTIGQSLIGRYPGSAMTGLFGFWYTVPDRISGVGEEYDHRAVGNTALTIYPNPVIDIARIDIALTSAHDVRLELFDALGREVRTLIEGHREAGTMSLGFGVEDLPAGEYTLVLTAGPSRHATAMRVIR
jgi:hypothetical protein